MKKPYAQLFEYMASKSDISLCAFEKIKPYYTYKKIKRKNFLLNQGDICFYGAFIVKGAMHMYQVNSDEQKTTIQFGLENWWICDRESFHNKKPSNNYIQAIEDVELLTFTLEDFNFLNENFPEHRNLITRIKEDNNGAVNSRLTSILTDSAETRYYKFKQKYPDIIQRFPQHLIASYLGIKPETLSRLRSRIRKAG